MLVFLQFFYVELTLDNSPTLDVNLQNNKKETAIEKAICCFALYYSTNPKYKDGSKDIIEQLAAHGAIFDITKLDENSEKSMQWPIAMYALEQDQITAMKQEVQKIYQAGRAIAEQHEKEQAVYKMEVANKLQEHIPVKDLNNIINEYTKMNLVEFMAKTTRT